MSHARTGTPSDLAQSDISEIGPLRGEPGPPPPAPSMQSTIKSQVPSGLDGHRCTPGDSSAIDLACDEASVLDLGRLATTADLPDRESEHAATNPSPPLLPGPHRNRTVPAVIAEASLARLSPAALIRSISSTPRLTALPSKTETSSQCIVQRERSSMGTNAPRRLPRPRAGYPGRPRSRSWRPTSRPGAPPRRSRRTGRPLRGACRSGRRRPLGRS